MARGPLWRVSELHINQQSIYNQIITETTIHSGLSNDIIQLGSSEFQESYKL